MIFVGVDWAEAHHDVCVLDEQGERLAMFLDMERLGLAQSYYPPTIYRQRKREAMKLGYASNDGAGEPLDVNLSELLTAYLGTVEAGVPPASSSQ